MYEYSRKIGIDKFEIEDSFFVCTKHTFENEHQKYPPHRAHTSEIIYNKLISISQGRRRQHTEKEKNIIKEFAEKNKLPSLC
jgi:hypothetical protein